MSARPRIRLEADGLPSIDFAVRSPNVDDSSSEEGQTGLVHAAAAIDEAASPSAAPDMYVHEAQVNPTQMDPSAETPPEKPRVPGSPPPLDIEAGLHEARGASPLSGHLRTMPSPLRTGRRSLSPREARDRGIRTSAEVIPENDRDMNLGESRNFVEDSLMGTSPCTEHSMDSLASFFRDGHYFVPLRLSSVDEPLAEPARHHREHDVTAESFEHRTPCVASFPCPLTCGGPGSLMSGSGRGALVPALPSAMGMPEPSVRQREVEPSVAPALQELQEMRSTRVGVPRVPGPTESVDLPGYERRQAHPRNMPHPSRAPVLADAVQSAAAPSVRHLPSSAFTAGDARVQEGLGAPLPNPSRPNDVPPYARTTGVPPATENTVPTAEGPGRRLGEGLPDLRTSGPMPSTSQLPSHSGTGGMLSVSSMAPAPAPGWGFAATSGHLPSGPPPAARPPVPCGIAQLAQAPAAAPGLPPGLPPGPPPAPCLAPNMYTSSGHAVPFQRDFAGVGVAPPPQASQTAVPAPVRAWGTQGPMAAAVQVPWPLQGTMAGQPTAVAPVQPVRAEVCTAGRMPTATVEDALPACGQGAVPTEPEHPKPKESVQATASQEAPLSARKEGPKSSGPIPASDSAPEQSQQSQQGQEGQEGQQSQAGLEPERPKLAQPIPEAPTVSAPSPAGPAPASPTRSPSFAAGVPDMSNLVHDGLPDITTPPPPDMIEKGQQTTPDKNFDAQSRRRKRAALEKTRLAKEGRFALVTVGMDKLKCLNQPGRPRRHQIRVLEHWRNERVLYERVRGSTMPTVCGVVVAQPCEKRDVGKDASPERIPIELTAKFGDVFSPCSSRKSDMSFQPGGLEDDDGESKFAKARRQRRRPLSVERAARAASAAAASALAAGAPDRALPRRTPTGFVEVPAAAGSTHACGIRVGLENGKWMCCDIRIPPRSFNTPEELAASRSLLIYVTSCEPGALTAAIDTNIVELSSGHSLVIRAGQEYCLRNSSAATTAQLKMVLINQTMPS